MSLKNIWINIHFSCERSGEQSTQQQNLSTEGLVEYESDVINSATIKYKK